MTSVGINVLRWSALTAGVLYGVNHQLGIKRHNKQAVEQERTNHQEDLIQKAKQEFAKKSIPQGAKAGDGGVISDPSNPQFDLEAYIKSVEAQQ